MRFLDDRLVLTFEKQTALEYLKRDDWWLQTGVGDPDGDHVYARSSERFSDLDELGRMQSRYPYWIPFIYERTRYFNELVPKYYMQFNDFVNAKIDAGGDISAATLYGINRIGNFKLNSRRNVFLIAEGFDQELLSKMILHLDNTGKIDVDYNFPDDIPLYPPNELIGTYETSPASENYLTSRIQLTATDTGYKHYIKSNNPLLPAKTATERWAFESRESSGYKSVVISPYKDDGTTVNPLFTLGSIQAGKDMSSAAGGTDWAALGNIAPISEHTNIDIPDIEAVMDRVYTESGDAFGTFLPDANSHVWINRPAHLKIQYYNEGASHPTDTTAYEMTLYKIAAVDDALVEGTHWWKETLVRDSGLWTFNGINAANKELNTTRFFTDANNYGYTWRVGHPSTNTSAFQMNLTHVANKGLWSAGLADGTLDVEVDETAGTIVLTAGSQVITMVLNTSITMTDGVSTILMDKTNIKLTGDVLIVGTLDVS